MVLVVCAVYTPRGHYGRPILDRARKASFSSMRNTQTAQTATGVSAAVSGETSKIYPCHMLPCLLFGKVAGEKDITCVG